MTPGDNNNTTTPINPQTLNDSSVALNAYNTAFSNLGTIITTISSTFDGLNTKFNAISSSLQNTTQLTNSGTLAFAGLANSLVNVKSQFDNLGSNIKFDGLNTFKNQFQALQDQIKGSPGSDVASGAISQLKSMLVGLGANLGDVNNKAKEGVQPLLDFANNIITGADNGLKMQSMLVQLAASQGNLNAMFGGDKGANISNFNNLLAGQADVLSKVQQATNLSSAEVNKFYAELGQLPGGIANIVKGVGQTGESVDLLTASIKLATGSGRDIDSVIKEVKASVATYGMTVDEAFSFTSKVGELSNKFKIPLDVMDNALKTNEENLKDFALANKFAGEQGQGVASIMNQYFGSFKDAGFTIGGATEAITKMTSATANMSIAQKAFLSAQTGGPGGLMGGFKIEQMLQEGKIDEVMKKVQTQMKKQFGNILTIDDATKSQGNAAQFERQVQLLQKGPLGQFAKNDQDAYKMLSAFKSGNTANFKDLMIGTQAAQTQVARGTKVQNTARTPISEMVSALSNAQYKVSVINLGQVENAFSKETGDNEAGPNVDAAARGKVKGYLGGNEEGGKLEKTAANINESAARAASAFGKLISSNDVSIGQMSGAVVDNMKASFSNNINKPQQTTDKAEMHRLSGNSAAQVHQATTNALVQHNKNKDNQPKPQDQQQHMQQKQQSKQEVHVKVEGICFRCKREMEVSEQSKSINPSVNSGY